MQPPASPSSQSSSDLESLKRHDLNLLVVLHCLLETTSVSETARRLDSTQPSVSRMLDRLRDGLGDPLLVKSSNRMLLTTRAERLRPLLAELVGMLHSVYRPADSYRLDRASRVCVIGANDAVQAIFAGPIIAAVRQRAPLATVIFKPVPYPNPMRALPEREVDLLLAISRFDEAGLRVRTLVAGEFSCLCSRDNPHVGAIAELESLARLPYLEVSHIGVISSITDEIFATVGAKKRKVAGMSSFLAAPEVIAGSEMVSLVPSYLGATLSRHPGVLVVPLSADSARYEVRMIWHNATHFDPFLADIRAIASQVAASMPGGLPMTHAGQTTA